MTTDCLAEDLWIASLIRYAPVHLVLLADSVENAALDGLSDEEDESDDEESDEDDEEEDEEEVGMEQRAHRARMRRLTELMPMLAWLCEQPGVNELTCRRLPRKFSVKEEEEETQAQAACDADAMAKATRLVRSAIAIAVAEGGEGDGLAEAMATLGVNESTLGVNESTPEAQYDDETLDDETLDDETLDDETLQTLEAHFDKHLERAVAHGRLSEAEADAMTDQIASKPNTAARCKAMRRIMRGGDGEKGGQGGRENEQHRSEGDAQDDAPELTLLQFVESIDRERAEHASKAPRTAPNWFGLERRQPPPPPPPQQQQQQQQQQQAVLAKGPSPFARLLRLEPSERGKVIESISSLPTWGGIVEGLTLVDGHWAPSSFSGETLDMALYNAEVQSKTSID